MIVTLVFLAGLAVIVLRWLSRQGLGTRPWLETGSGAALPDPVLAARATAKLGLGVFLAVAGALLALLFSAYLMRMEQADWRPLPWPRLLWFNTGVLVVSSLALQAARAAARRGDRDGVQFGLLAGGLAAVLFLAGQLLAWHRLAAAGYRPAANPADAFFYLLTALHGLHVLGGLAALVRAGARLGGGAGMPALGASVALCATYWHFLLLAWIAMFGLLVFSPSFLWLYALCTAPFG